MADYNSDRTGANIDATLDKVDALDAKVQPTATGANVTGTVTTDGLVVDGVGRIEETGAAARFIIARTDAVNSSESASLDLLESSVSNPSFGTTGSWGYRLEVDGLTNKFNIVSGTQTGTSNRFSIDRDTGDVSFYEDTGTTAKMVWDASAESLGIGTASPSYPIHGETTGSGTTSGSNTVLFLASQASGRDVNIRMGDGVNATARIGYDTGHLYAFTNGSERMRIDSAGNVGIGTASPNAKLDVLVGGDQRFLVSTVSDDVSLNAVNGANAAYQELFINGSTLKMATGGTERARIDSSGSLLIGTTISAGLANSVFVRKGGDGQLLLGANDGGLYHQAEGSYYLVTTAGGSTSDINLKKDITELETPLEKVCKIRGVNFQYKDKQKSTSDNGVQLGVIAQEVEAVFPEIVLTNSEGVKTVRYDRLVAPLIEAVKEQNKLINDLKTRIEILESK